MKLILKSALIAVAGLATSAAKPGGPTDFACSARGGFFDEIANVSAGSEHRIRGAVMPQRFWRHSRTRPTATVQLRSSPRRAAIALQFMRRGTGNAVDVLVVMAGPDRQRRWNIGSLRLNDEMSFELSASSTSVHIVAGARVMDVPIDLGESPEVSVSCSTGEFRFRSLDWGGVPVG